MVYACAVDGGDIPVVMIDVIRNCFAFLCFYHFLFLMVRISSIRGIRPSAEEPWPLRCVRSAFGLSLSPLADGRLSLRFGVFSIVFHIDCARVESLTASSPLFKWGRCTQRR